MDWHALFQQSLPYREFLDRDANPAQRRRWDDMRGRVSLNSDQTRLLSSFKRAMPVFCLAGAWCGDCINQCPIFDAFAQASPAIDLRFLDRDALPEETASLTINGGKRVPVVVFLSEDYREVFRYGERVISIYRKLALEQVGPSCPTGTIAPHKEFLDLVVAEWLAEFERAQLVLRLSPRLRELHGD
ncbi:MAG: hypothetical protein NVSMB14_17420 [Isosphaeraceae bacterium]